jgi:hypothetical protein
VTGPANGSGLGARYVFLPGLAEFSQVPVDKFELAGFKVIRNQVVTMRLWRQLWDAEQGTCSGNRPVRASSRASS